MTDHLDADIIAAWMEGTLAANEQASAEAHAADCDRCRAMLAAMVRTEPPVAPRASWFPVPVRWLVPVATAAVALLVWNFAVAPPPARVPEVAVDAPAAPAAIPAEPPAVTRAPVAPSANAATAKEDGRAARTGGATAPTDALARKREERPQGLAAQSAPVAAPAAPAPPAAAAADRAQTMAESFAVAPSEIVARDGSVRWRFGAGGRIQRSGDGGKTWAEQRSPVTTDLLAAAAPSADVCWIVGRAGVVLLSTDGKTWTRIPFPESVDLTAVTATDAKTAHVTTIDARRFRTNDGGTTWVTGEGEKREQSIF